MQISAQTLLASQQTAQIQPRLAPGFAAALDKNEGFAALPLKQIAPAQDAPAAPPPSPKGYARLGAMIDIKV